jgi:hypothetical protein
MSARWPELVAPTPPSQQLSQQQTIRERDHGHDHTQAIHQDGRGGGIGAAELLVDQGFATFFERLSPTVGA